MKYLIFLALSFLSVSASAFNPVDCSNPRNEVQLYVCQDAQLSELNNQSIVLAIDVAGKNSYQANSLEEQFQNRVANCNFSQTCWVQAYQDLIAGYEELKRQYEQRSTAPEKPVKSEDGFWGSFASYFMIFMIILLAIYFLPTIIAFNRQHRHRWVILIVNVVFGCTLLGWLVALVWAFNKFDSPVKGGSKYDPQPHDPSI